MTQHRRLRLLLAAALGAVAQVQAQECSNSLEVDYPRPVVADGWSYRLVANGFSRPRSILFDADGGLVLVDAGEGLFHLRLRDDGEDCLSVDEKTALVENADLNHGVALSQDGHTLYASTDDEVYAWDYDSAGPSVDASSRRTLVTNMTNSGHTTRTLLLSRLQPGTLLVSRGSQGNEDPDAADISSGHSQLRAFNLSSLAADDDPYQFLDGELLAWGLRNSVGIAEDPVTGGVWTVENSVDEMTRNGEDVHENNPGEELNFHGRLNDSSSEERGANYGYPSCYTLWSTDNFPDRGDLTTGDQFPMEESNTLNDQTCNEDFVAPRLAFQAHVAPLDIVFSKDASEAFISFHGSWNRDEPAGYKVVSVAFTDGEPTAARDSMDAAKDILSAPELDRCPGECFRPVGFAWDEQERLFVTSDSTGEIFVLRRDGDGQGGGSGGDGSGNGGNGSTGGDDGGNGDGDDNAVGRVAGSTWAVGLAALLVGLLMV